MASIRCENCGAPKRREDKGECAYCGSHYSYKEEDYANQSEYREQERSHTYSRTYEQAAATSYGAHKEMSRRVIAAVLALFLGSFGAQFFYTGKTFLGIVALIFFWTGIPSIIGLAQGIIWLLMTDADFESRYPGA